MNKRLVLALAVFATSARAQTAPQLPPPPPPSTTPQYEPPPPPSQGTTPNSGAPTRAYPRRERPERPEPPREREPVRRPPPPVERYEPVERDYTPRARTGFQLALRLGLSFPLGNVSGAPLGANLSDSLSNQFGLQVPFILDAGWKPIPALFLGVYASIAVGAAGSSFKSLECPDGSGRSCNANQVRLGLEAQYSFDPGDRLNPWIGYGFGFESADAAAGADVSESFSGFEFARLSGGFDYRFSHYFGLGPFGDLALGEYTHEHLQGVGGQQLDQPIEPRAFHAWLTLGVRGVLFP